ncbi:dystroglycan-like [Dorcoceras hygrometricum]|uniref:Dystroglycan-like n=1 Tax=Dorcoceras hygrometricum TaxID=472368 RepID=A0A2Z7C9R5_9LAMI|nr:dystroglycan-like [Dorcoceras hygrometricum]
MDDPGMVSMFEALMASGLRGFLGCPAIVYEDALVDFFENASVRSGVVISTVGGQFVKISEKLFAETFELPVDGLGDLSEMPKDAIFDARSIVSLSGELSLSGRKNQMKMPFRLLCDIVAKAISAKAGSFNAITVEKFSLITAVVCGVKMNWAKFLFGVLKKMVSAKSKQAKGFAIQISLLLATFPTVELGESSEFPASKILSKNTVLRFVSINDRDGAEEVTGAAKKKVVSKKRPAADIEAAVPKKKRTSKKKSISSISSLELVEVAEEAIPIQQVAEPLDAEEPRCSSADAVDLIIQQVLDETRAADAPADITQPSVYEEKNWFDLPYGDLVKQWEAERPVVTASDTEDEDIATIDVAPADEVQQGCGDRPAELPLCPAKLPETPANGHADPNNKSRKNKYEVKPQYEELSKQINMQHATNQCYECMRPIKKSDIARPVYQLATQIKPLYHGLSTGKSSVRDHRGPSAHHSAVVDTRIRAVTPTFEQRVQMAQRRIVQTVLDADANRESKAAAERDRE